MAEIFTRGGLNVPDKRGDALMQLHAEKLQRAKEEAALKAMKRLVPNLSPAVWVLALEECSWDVERATVLLNTFQASQSKELEAIQKALKRLSDAPGADPAAEEGARRRPKEQHKRKKQKREKKEKKEKKDKTEKTEPSTMKDAFGRFGIIGEADISSKYSEFALWASEAKKLDIEVLPKLEEKELFRTFCEDFNTATLPHKKYYNLHEYQQKKAERAARRGSSDDEEPMAFNDEEELRRKQVAERAVAQQERLRDAYLELKHSAPGKAEDMREQEMLRSQMALAYRTGDRDKAAQIQERLKPDEVKEREAARRMDPENPLGV